MAEPEPLEPRPLVHELRERVGRMLIGVARQRAQGLDLADRREPDRHARSHAQAPGLDRQGELRRPEERQRQRREELVAPRFQQLLESSQALHLQRRGQAVRVQPPPQRDERRRCETLPLQAGEDRREESEVAARPIRRLHGAFDTRVEQQGPRPRDRQRDDQRPRSRSQPPEKRGQHVERRKRRGEGTSERREAGGRRRGPASERIGSHSRADVLSGEGEVLAQVEARAQLRDGPLPFAHLAHRGGAPQPARERLLPRTGARRADELEERAVAEEIQVGRVRVRVVLEAFAGLARPGPAVLDAREAALVESDRALGAGGDGA